MRDNDLSNEPTRRYWVVSDVVLVRSVTHETERSRWLKTLLRTRTTVVPNLAALSKLWRWSSGVGARLELAFVEDDVRDAPELWDLLEKGSANPFSDWLGFEDHAAISTNLAWRPDLLGVIDVPARSMVYGGKGLTLESIP